MSAPMDMGGEAAAEQGEAQENEKAHTESRKVMARDLRRRRLLWPEDVGADIEVLAKFEPDRPKERGDCAGQTGPCIWAACPYNLYLDVNPETGSVKFNFPGKEIWEIEHICALDVADRGGSTLEDVGDIMNLTRERIRQVETRVLEKIRAAVETGIPRNLPETRDVTGKALIPGDTHSLLRYQNRTMPVPVATDLRTGMDGKTLCEWEGRTPCRSRPMEGRTLCADHKILRAKMVQHATERRLVVPREVESIPSVSILGAA